jgi:Fe-S-cluster containining protein
VVPACLSCGACCFGTGERYVAVSGDDHARLADEGEGLTVFIGNRCYMRMEHGHCAALELCADGTFVCGVYALRPTVCRELARGSGECRGELALKHALGQRALLPLLVARR